MNKQVANVQLMAIITRTDLECSIKERLYLYLGIGLANLVNLFNPREMIIDTGDFEKYPELLKVAEENIME